MTSSPPDSSAPDSIHALQQRRVTPLMNENSSSIDFNSSLRCISKAYLASSSEPAMSPHVPRSAANDAAPTKPHMHAPLLLPSLGIAPHAAATAGQPARGAVRCRAQ
jgi:hypothetical protein